MSDAEADYSVPGHDKTSFVLPDPARLEALAEFAAGAGHEINNPLATIIGRAQLLLKDEHDPQRRQMLMSIGAQAYRIRDMIGDVMLFGRPPRPEFTNVNVGELVDGVLGKLDGQLLSEHCTVRRQIENDLIVRADSSQIAIVVSELFHNSRQAMQPDGGQIQISASTHQGEAIIEIVDQGKGFTELEQRHAFDPFFSGRQAGRGLGFGLSKCWRIIDQHGGQLKIDSSAGGTTVRMTLPLSSSSISSSPESA